MTRSTMFFGSGSVTQIDYAVIDSNGHIVGGSVSPSFLITGDVETEEQVVIDFSACKKLIKGALDSNETGIDHKLVITPTSNVSDIEFVKGHYNIHTPMWDIKLPYDAVCLVESNIEDKICDIVYDKLSGSYPAVEVEGFVNSTFQPVKPDISTTANFRYSHGLKNSSSYGCQNICHGHLSYVHVVSPDKNEGMLLSQQIASDLDGKMFVFLDNYQRETGVSYKTMRGDFHVKPLTREAYGSVISFSKDTTIENLVEHIAGAGSKALKAIGATEIWISEGLSKGAVFKIRS